jgi:hypothetical protein
MKDISDRFVTLMGILVGLAVAPVVFLCTFPWIDAYMPWLNSTKVNPLHVKLTFWLPIFVAIAWTFFAAIGWKRGNVGIRIGLTLVIWAFVVAIVLTVLAGLAIEAL